MTLLEQQAAGRLRSWFAGPMTIERSAEMRYGEQIFEIDVNLDDLDWNAASLVDALAEYGLGLADAAAEVGECVVRPSARRASTRRKAK